MTHRRLVIAKGLAAAFLAGEWDPPAMTRRGQRAVAQRRVWVRSLALAARHEYPDAPRDRPRELTAFLDATRIVADACAASADLRVRHWFVAPTAMGERPWPAVPLATMQDVRDLLGLSESHLLWFADAKGLERSVSDERLRHYRYRWIAKSSGGARLIEQPKTLLKHIHRVLLREILDQVPPHAAAHGFTTGRSAITYAQGHVGQHIVVHLDLEDFFGSVTAGRVFAIFRRCGYPEPVAHLLTSLVTNRVPSAVLRVAPRPRDPALLSPFRRQAQHLAHPHLPQGAPTSPALANLAAFALDRRLSGLAVRADAAYSRYADDLAFSFARPRSDTQVDRLVDLIASIARDEGFRLNTAKTSVRRARQRQRLAGIIVNEKPNIDRREHDRLKALLHNAARDGAASQNRAGHPQFAAHVLGRIGWVTQLNPDRGARLRRAYDAVDWTESG
jgi:RNA-directed DNA polymerase